MTLSTIIILKNRQLSFKIWYLRYNKIEFYAVVAELLIEEKENGEPVGHGVAAHAHVYVRR